jgi:aminopeptidase N
VQRNGDHVTINQRQFFIGEGNDAQQRWPIPLHGTSSQIPELLDTESAQFSYTDKVPLQLNQGGTAHFITHYDKASLQALLEYLPSLPTIDRLQLLHEQTLLAQAGIISSADLLPLLEYYKDETEETVWGIISLAINELKRFVETDEQAEAKLRRLVGTLALPQYERLGWEPAPGETENDTKLRSLIISLSLYGEIPDALETAKQTYKTTPLSELDPELRTAILANAVRQKVDDDIIDTLLAAYKKTQHSEVRDDIAAAITATKELAVIQRLVPLMKDASIVRSQDFLHWYIWLLRNRYGRSYMWQWTQDDWEWLKDTFSGDSHYDMLPRYIAGSLITQEHLEQFVSFFTPYQSDIALKRNILIGETELKAKVALLERDGALVRQRLIEA